MPLLPLLRFHVEFTRALENSNKGTGRAVERNAFAMVPTPISYWLQEVLDPLVVVGIIFCVEFEVRVSSRLGRIDATPRSFRKTNLLLTPIFTALWGLISQGDSGQGLDHSFVGYMPSANSCVDLRNS
jgi:hypothetical protein